MPFDQLSLRLFACAVEHANIAKASRANSIAASAVSKRISDLEVSIGASLLYRGRDGVAPTPAGQALYRFAKQTARLEREVRVELGEYATGAKGHVRLWANTSSLTQFLPESLAAYITRFPDVRIALRESTSALIVDAVRKGVADIGVFSSHTDSVDLETRAYRNDRLMVLAPPGHPLFALRSARLADLENYSHVGLQEGSSLQEKIDLEAAASGIRIRTRVHAFGFDGVRRMVEAGLGIAILPAGAVLPYVGRTISAIPLNETWGGRAMVIGFQDHGSLTAAARAMIDSLTPERETT